MPDKQVSEEQAQAIAQAYGAMADAIADFIIAHAASLTPEQRLELGRQQNICLQCADASVIQGLTDQQNQLDASADELRDALAQANQAIENIARTDRGLQIATAVAVLGASILRADYSSIPGELKGIWTAASLKIKPGDDGNSTDKGDPGKDAKS